MCRLIQALSPALATGLIYSYTETPDQPQTGTHIKTKKKNFAFFYKSNILIKTNVQTINGSLRLLLHPTHRVTSLQKHHATHYLPVISLWQYSSQYSEHFPLRQSLDTHSVTSMMSDPFQSQHGAATWEMEQRLLFLFIYLFTFFPCCKANQLRLSQKEWKHRAEDRYTVYLSNPGWIRPSKTLGDSDTGRAVVLQGLPLKPTYTLVREQKKKTIKHNLSKCIGWYLIVFLVYVVFEL